MCAAQLQRGLCTRAGGVGEGESCAATIVFMNCCTVLKRRHRAPLIRSSTSTAIMPPLILGFFGPRNSSRNFSR